LNAISNNFPFVVFFANLGTLAVVWFGGLIAFNSYLGFLVQPILTLGFLAASISRAGASALRVFEVLDAPLEVTDKPGAKELPSVKGRVEFRDVRFRYVGDGREILRGVSFSAEPGQVVALLGTTGSGKSTLTNLIPRFYDATGGAVLIDGLDVREVARQSLRSNIAMVLQEAFLFSGTVGENIRYGKLSATQAEVEAAAWAVNAHDFIAALPQGYDTPLGEGGGNLSQGQRQLLSFARAVLADPRILILDEATANVDTRTEAMIQKALETLLKGRTSVAIAHRLSTVQNADLILVIEAGRILERGTHATLLEQNGRYAELYRRQFRDPPARPATAPEASLRPA
jgi:ATP-binding cassette, subfamily B, multidrug efflux pump